MDCIELVNVVTWLIEDYYITLSNLNFAKDFELIKL